jgi:hypothetical protein
MPRIFAYFPGHFRKVYAGRTPLNTTAAADGALLLILGRKIELMQNELSQTGSAGAPEVAAVHFGKA